MLRQSKNQPLILALLMAASWSCSLNAFSSGVKKIEILQKIGIDTDTYSVKAMPDKKSCVDHVWPLSVQTVPRGDNGQIMHIKYLSLEYFCYSEYSAQKFEVQGKEHPDRIAKFWWIKYGGHDPFVKIYKNDDLYQLLWIDNQDSDKIKVWVSYDG